MQNQTTGFALHLEKCQIVSTKVTDIIVGDCWIRLNTTNQFSSIKEIDGEYVETLDNYVLIPKSAFLHTIGLIADYKELVKLMRMVPEIIQHIMLNADIDISVYKRLANSEYIDYKGDKRMNTNDYTSVLYNVADVYFESATELFATAIKLAGAVIALDDDLASKYRSQIADMKSNSVLSSVRRRQRATTATTTATDSTANTATAEKPAEK